LSRDTAGMRERPLKARIRNGFARTGFAMHDI
jgi:hypothetical protein